MLLSTLCLSLALANASQSEASSYGRDNVVICLDASGSMKESMPGSALTKMQAARQAIATVLAGVPMETQVGLLVFSGEGKESGDWVFDLGKRDDRTLIQRLNQITPRGGTPLGAYMVKGTESLLAQRAQQNGYGTYRLLVVTDGEASDKEVLAAAMPDIRTRGLMLDVIGVNMSGAHSLANDVSSYRSADDHVALQEAIRQVFAEVGAQGTDSVEDDFELLEAFPDGAVKGVIERLAFHDDGPIVMAAKTTSRRSKRSSSGNVPTPKRPTPRSGGDSGGISPLLFIATAMLLFFGVRAAARKSRP